MTKEYTEIACSEYFEFCKQQAEELEPTYGEFFERRFAECKTPAQEEALVGMRVDNLARLARGYRYANS